jgi:hypothetical protein
MENAIVKIYRKHQIDISTEIKTVFFLVGTCIGWRMKLRYLETVLNISGSTDLNGTHKLCRI